jgi:hypothetical protein
MFENKAPLMIDVNTGQVGAWLGDKTSDEPGMVFPMFVPLNQPFTKVTYSQAVKKDCIKQVMPGNSHLQGSQRSIVIISRPDQDGFFKTGNEELLKKMRELQRELDHKKTQIATLEKEVRESASGTAKKVAEAKKITGSRSGFDPLHNNNNNNRNGNNNNSVIRTPTGGFGRFEP